MKTIFVMLNGKLTMVTVDVDALAYGIVRIVG